MSVTRESVARHASALRTVDGIVTDYPQIFRHVVRCSEGSEELIIITDKVWIVNNGLRYRVVVTSGVEMFCC